MIKKILVLFILYFMSLGFVSAQNAFFLDTIWRIGAAVEYKIPLSESGIIYYNIAESPFGLFSRLEVENLFADRLLIAITSRAGTNSYLSVDLGYHFYFTDLLSWVPEVSIGVGEEPETFIWFPYCALSTYFSLELAFGFAINTGISIAVDFVGDQIYPAFIPFAGLSVTIFPREETISTSMPPIVIDSARLDIDEKLISPNGDGILDSIEFIPSSKAIFSSHELRIMDWDGKIVKIFYGTEKFPNVYVWDGMDVPDGEYHAELILFQEDKEISTYSRSFVIDTKPITAVLALSNGIISPDDDKKNDTVDLMITSDDSVDLKKWNLKIFDRVGNLFWEKSGTKLNASFTWDGRSSKGELVQSAEIYKIELTIFDKASNKTVIQDEIKADIIVSKIGANLKIVIPSIAFIGDSADFTVGDPLQVKRNMEIMDQLVITLKKYEGYDLIINGYATNVNDSTQAAIDKENIEELIPLSLRRADNIRNALVARGISFASISIVGKGNLNPVFPLSDSANQWKNRRVEFILIKKPVKL